MESSKEFKTIDEYIALFPADVKARLNEFRDFIRKLVPEAEETISYKMPTFKTNGKNLAYFAGYKSHIGFYPFPSGIEMFQKLASEYKTSKGTVQFPHDKPIPYDLVKKVIEYRVKENKEKAKQENQDYSK